MGGEVRTKDISRLFSSTNISKLAHGDFSFLNMVLQSRDLNLEDSFTISDILDRVFQLLLKEYRNEYVFKTLIAQKILLGRHSLKTSTQINEFRAGRCVADTVVINGATTCYEIKTEFDSLDRLGDQISEYRKIFDKINVITVSKYADEVINNTPDFIGVLELSDKLTFKTLRTARCVANGEFDTVFACSSLRTKELKILAESLVNEPVISNNVELNDKCIRIIQDFNVEQVKFQFRKVLKQSRSVDQELIADWPSSLLNAAIEYRFRKMDVKRLSSILCKPLREGKSNVLSSAKGQTV
jgi:hypothetical protein